MFGCLKYGTPSLLLLLLIIYARQKLPIITNWLCAIAVGQKT
jgi:hypothetical protein